MEICSNLSVSEVIDNKIIRKLAWNNNKLGLFFLKGSERTPGPAPYQLKTDRDTCKFNFMVGVNAHAACLKGLRAQIWLLSPYLQRSSPAPSSCIGHQKPYKINPFSAHDSLPNGVAALRGPGAQCGNDLRVKGRLVSSSIKGKDCNCTMHRLSEKKGPAVTRTYVEYIGTELA